MVFYALYIVLATTVPFRTEAPSYLLSAPFKSLVEVQPKTSNHQNIVMMMEGYGWD